MNVVGLIVEYNPLHNGHQYHFEQAKKQTNADVVVIIMSGNFLQRGEPALVNKWARTEMALQLGVDLIFELPYAYATGHAHHFAFGAVSLLDHLPFVTHICFGSESGEISQLKKVAQILADEPEQFAPLLKKEMNTGVSYPKAHAKILSSFLKTEQIDPSLFTKPNNILGLYYIAALYRLRSSIIPHSIKRKNADYHQTSLPDTHIASATSIRHSLLASTIPEWSKIKPYIPSFTLDILQREASAGRGLVSWEDFYSVIIHSYISQSINHLGGLYEMEEGIEHRFKKKALKAMSINHLCQLVKSKRYTWNRIQRMMVHTLMQFTKNDASSLLFDQSASYLRLLGFSDKGKQLLNQYKKELRLPLISSIKKDHPPLLDWDLKAAQIYTLAYSHSASLYENKREFKQAPIYHHFEGNFSK